MSTFSLEPVEDGAFSLEPVDEAPTATPGQAFTRAAAQALTLNTADEINAFLTSKGLDPFNKQVPYEQQLAKARGLDVAMAEQQPVASLLGSVSGGVAGTAAALAAAPASVPAALTSFAAKGLPNALAVSGGTGALSGALYGFGGGEGGLQSRLEAATSSGALGGLLGVGGAAVARPVASLAERALRLVSRKAGTAPAAVAPTAKPSMPQGTISRQPKPMAQPVAPVETMQGGVIPLTKGQATQDANRQALENMARGGAAGDVAQAAVLRSDFAQQDAIRGAVSKLVGEPTDEALVGSAGLLKQGYKDIKSQVSKAYDNAALIRNVFVDKKPIAEAFAPRINDIMRNQGFDASNISSESKRLFDDLQMLKDPKINALNLEKMEFWRRKVNNRAEQMRGDPEGVMMQRVVRAYDDFMAKLPNEALKGGDETALKAINEARSLRKRQGVLFEKNKAVEQIVRNDQLTNEQLANLVLTGNQGQQAVGAGTGAAIKAMKLAAGDNAEALLDGIRKGAMAKVLTKAQTTQLRGNTEVQMLSAPKMAKELDNLLNNRSFMREVFDEQSRNTLFALRNDLRKIASEQPGARNYSNTAYTVLRALKNMPMGLGAVGGIAEIGLKPVAERSARQALEESLAPVLNEVQSELVGNARIYGAAAGGATGGLEKNESESQ